MKLLILVLLISSAAYGQSTYYIRADSVRFQKVGGNTTFILENATRAKTGAYLRNRLDGRTDFYYAVDSASVSGSNLILWRGGGTQNITVGITGSGTAWNLTGNASTVAGTNFVGTTDAVDLVFKTNGTEIGRFQNLASEISFGYGASAIGDSSIAIGVNSATQSASNIAIGTSAGRNSSAGGIFIGKDAGVFNTGTNVTAVGQNAGKENTGNFLTAFGLNAGFQSVGIHNTAIGREALQLNNGTNNTGVGYTALKTSTGNFNVALGEGAGTLNVGDYGTFLGYRAGDGNLGDSVVLIGYGVATDQPGNRTVIIGANAGFNNAYNSSIILGQNSLASSNNQFALSDSIFLIKARGMKRSVVGYVLTDSTGNGDLVLRSPASLGVPISSLTAATAGNTINNANNSQIWQWNSLSAIGLTLQSNTTAAAGGSALLYLESTGANASSGITQSGIVITNNHSGTTSTNIGANISVAGATTNYGVLSSVSASATTNIGGSFSASGATTNNAINIAAGALTLNNSAGTSGQVLTSAGPNTLPTWTTPAAGGTVIPSIYDFRITTETGVPVPTGDNTSEGTIYMTPYKGNHISLYSGAAWVDHTTAEISLALTVTSGSNYDVFAYNNAGTITLELSDAWTNDNTRDDALTRQDGVWVKSGATTRRWIGTIRASGSNVTEDSEGGSTTQVGGKRFVWNAYNQVQRTAKVIDKTDSWSYTTATWRQANGNAGNQIEYVSGDASVLVVGEYDSNVYLNNPSARAAVGIGVSSTTTPTGGRPSFYTTGAVASNGTATYKGTPGLGYFFITALEYGTTATDCIFSGDDGGANFQTGLGVTIFN